MRIGVSTLTYVDVPYRQALERLRPLGVSVVELFFDYPHFDVAAISSEDVRFLRRYRDETGVDYTLHTPCFDLNPASVNKGARDEAVRQHEQAIRFAAELEIREVVVHSGYRSDPRVSDQQCVDLSVDSLRRTIRTAEQHGVRLAVENTGYGPKGFISEPATVLEIVKAGESELVGVTLDTGHAILEGFTPDAAVAAFGGHLSHIHIHNNGGRADDHGPLDRGVIDFRPLFEALTGGRYDGYLIVESFDQERPEELLTGDLGFIRRHTSGRG